jgi:hypothetical protein
MHCTAQGMRKELDNFLELLVRRSVGRRQNDSITAHSVHIPHRRITEQTLSHGGASDPVRHLCGRLERCLGFAVRDEFDADKEAAAAYVAHSLN